MESETLSRLSRVTESAQEIVDSIPYNRDHILITTKCQVYYLIVEVCFTRIGDFTWSCL